MPRPSRSSATNPLPLVSVAFDVHLSEMPDTETQNDFYLPLSTILLAALGAARRIGLDKCAFSDHSTDSRDGRREAIRGGRPEIEASARDRETHSRSFGR